jgi:hypothetical protein
MRPPQKEQVNHQDFRSDGRRRVAELEQEVERARWEVDELRRRLTEREDGLHASEAALALERAKVAAAGRAVAMEGGVDAPPPPPGLGDDELPDEVMLKICGFLGVRELGRLGCVSQRFAEKSIAAPSGVWQQWQRRRCCRWRRRRRGGGWWGAASRSAGGCLGLV